MGEIRVITMNPEKCDCLISDFYDNVAIAMGIDNIKKIKRYDCRKICVSKRVQEILWHHYSEDGYSDITIAQLMLNYGPKANVEGDDLTVQVEEGFITWRA